MLLRTSITLLKKLVVVGVPVLYANDVIFMALLGSAEIEVNSPG